MLALKLVQPGQQYVTAKVRGRRQLQDTTDVFLPMIEQASSFVQAAQGGASIGQKTIALAGQAQAAGRTGQQANAQLLLKALEGRAGHCR
ncbi:hypothetical protein D3C87_1992300 [compost metagenome]